MPKGVYKRSAKKKGEFQVNSKNHFLTYSSCPLEKELVLAKLEEIFAQHEVRRISVARENHQDGTLHIHALVCLAGVYRTTDVRYADVSGYHPNRRRIYDLKGAAAYVEKDGDFIVKGACQNMFEKKPKTSASNLVASLLEKGESLLSVNKAAPGFLLLNYQKVKQYQNWICCAAKDWSPSILPDPVMNASGNQCQILRWIALNCMTSRTFRQNQLYIWGPPKMGKTSMCQTLSLTFKSYFPCLAEKYFDGFDDTYELLVFDEFCGGVQLSLLKQILDGQVCILPQRFQSFLKTKNIPVIICSNHSPEEVYRKVSGLLLESFITRLLVVYVDEFINIFNK